MQSQLAATLRRGNVVFVLINGSVRQAVVNEMPAMVLNDVFVEVRLGCVHLITNTIVVNADRVFLHRSDAVTAANLSR